MSPYSFIKLGWEYVNTNVWHSNMPAVRRNIWQAFHIQHLQSTCPLDKERFISARHYYIGLAYSMCGVFFVMLQKVYLQKCIKQKCICTPCLLEANQYHFQKESEYVCMWFLLQWYIEKWSYMDSLKGPGSVPALI